jgi:putative sporulation protein YyaC
LLVTSELLAKQLLAVLPRKTKLKNLIFFCIGTDRSTGDSLGPLVGSKLLERGFTNVIGTLEDPTHAINLSERINEIKKGSIVMAIDACLGQPSSVAKFRVEAAPIKPGGGVNKDLPPVGDVHIAGVVNVGGFMEYFVLQNTRLSLVMKMADDIVNAISEVAVTLNSPRRKRRGGKGKYVNPIQTTQIAQL